MDESLLHIRDVTCPGLTGRSRKRVLFIAYYFPPLGLGGVQRATKFVKYLPKYGWDPRVLTVKPVSYFAEDSTLLEEFDTSVIVRTESFDPLRIRERWRLNRTLNPLKVVKSLPQDRQRMVRTILNYLFFPDSKIPWVPDAVKTGARLIHREGMDLIFSTSPPQSGHLVGYALYRRTGLPWIMDYRDDPTGRDDLTLPTPFHRKGIRWLTRKMIGSAKHVITVSRPIASTIERMTQRKDLSVIPNGFDTADFHADIRFPGKRFTLTYCGTMNTRIRPDPLFKAVRILLRRDPALRSRILLRFTGCVIGFTFDRIIRKYGLDDIVQWDGYVPHKTCIRTMCDADMLLLYLPESTGEGMVTGKIFEYLASGRPVLAVVPPGEAQKIILRHARGVVIHPTDIEGIVNHLQRSFELWARGDLELSIPRWKDIEIYSRERQTEKLARIFDTALNARNKV